MNASTCQAVMAAGWWTSEELPRTKVVETWWYIVPACQQIMVCNVRVHFQQDTWSKLPGFRQAESKLWVHPRYPRVNTGTRGANDRNSSEGFGSRTGAELAVEARADTGSRGADDRNSSEGFGSRTWAELAVETRVNTGTRGANDRNSPEGFGSRTWAELAVEARADIATRRHPIRPRSLPISCPAKWSGEVSTTVAMWLASFARSKYNSLSVAKSHSKLSCRRTAPVQRSREQQPTILPTVLTPPWYTNQLHYFILFQGWRTLARKIWWH